VGFEWMLRDSLPKGLTPFDNRLNELRQYKNDNGHTRVPHVYATNPPLGRWVHMQKQFYRQKSLGKKCPLTDARIEVLNKIDFEWSFGRWEGTRSWQEWYEKLKKFKKEFGHTFPTKAYDAQFYTWVSHQRKIKSLPSALARERIEALDRLDFVSSATNETQVKSSMTCCEPNVESQHMSLDENWKRHFVQLKKFKEKFGHTYVTNNYDSTLKQWTCSQRHFLQAEKQGTPTARVKERIDALEVLGFDWVAQRLSGGKPSNKVVTKIVLL